jgi:Family of unknown function (DUF6172)
VPVEFFAIITKRIDMKKSFKLKIAGKNDDRVIESVKHELRQYIKREKRKPLTEGIDFWEFDCKFGKTAAAAEDINFSQITGCIDAAAQNGDEEFYIEILAKAGSKGKVKIVSD